MTDDSNVRTGRSTNLLGGVVHRQLVRVHAGADDAKYASGTQGGEHDPRYAHPPMPYPWAYDQHAAYEQPYVGNDAAAYEADPDVAVAGYDETHEEPVRERRRGSLITAAVILGLAVVSTAGVL